MVSLCQALSHLKRAIKTYELFLESHARLVEMTSTIINIHSRLPALLDHTSFQCFASQNAGLQQMVYNQQLAAFDALLEKVLEKMYGLGSHGECDSIGRV
jgi:hypothetical protein